LTALEVLFHNRRQVFLSDSRVPHAFWIYYQVRPLLALAKATALGDLDVRQVSLSDLVLESSEQLLTVALSTVRARTHQHVLSVTLDHECLPVSLD